MLKNTRGQADGFGLVFFVILILVVLIMGFAAAMIWSVVDLTSDTVTPIMTELGVVGGSTNISEYSEYGFGTMNNMIQVLPWVIGLGYVLALVFLIVGVVIIGYNPHPAFIAFFFVLMILLIFGAIIMSNIYEDFYGGDDDIGSRLREQTLLSYLILHSPFNLALIMIIGGILMFARHSSNDLGAGVGV